MWTEGSTAVLCIFKGALGAEQLHSADLWLRDGVLSQGRIR
jgi:hypothetical protein